MSVKEVLEYYGESSSFAEWRFRFKFIIRFVLEKIAFFCPIQKLRLKCHKLRGLRVGKDVYIGHEVLIDRVYTDQISIGDNSAIGDRTIITAHSNIPTNTNLKKLYPRTVKPVKIGKGVWIAPNVTIIMGVTIGDESVIGTGSVVIRDVPPRTVVAGNPAKILKELK